MAEVYVDSNAVGTGTGANWANAFTTLNAALTAKAAGDNFWVAQNHAESTAGAITHTSPGTLATPCFIYCVNKAGSVPPVSADLRTTATISTTGASGITQAGVVAVCYGITFKSGDAGNTASLILANTGVVWRYKSCGFTINNTSNSSRLIFNNTGGATGVDLLFDSCTFTFGSSTSQFSTTSAGRVRIRIIGGSFAVGANVPTTVFSTWGSDFQLIGVDLSAFGSGKTLFAAAAAAGGTAILLDCKLGASVTVAATPLQLASDIYVIRSDSGNTNYNQQKYNYLGTQTIDTTTVRTGGASAGTPISWKLVGTANAKWTLPFQSIVIPVFNPRVAQNVTLTVHGTWGGGAVPNNDNVWMSVEYLGTSSFPLGVINTGTKADNLAAGGAQSADTVSVWGAGGTTQFQMSTTLSSPQPTLTGAMHVYIYVATTTTVWIDPLVVLS